MDKYGGFFPAIAKNPELYIRKRDNMVEILKKLKEKGKKLFILTDALHDFYDLTMTYSYGKNWMELFDLCIGSANKPAFFKNTSQVCFKLDLTKPVFCGEIVKGPLELNKEYILGSYQDLEKTFEVALGKKDIKYLYFGDSFVGDCYWCSKLKNWESVVIVEELSNL